MPTVSSTSVTQPSGSSGSPTNPSPTDQPTWTDAELAGAYELMEELIRDALDVAIEIGDDNVQQLLLSPLQSVSITIMDYYRQTILTPSNSPVTNGQVP
jgi:hypothetical protein